MDTIEVMSLTKDYGENRGIFGIDLDLRRGEMLGFVGTNGSGKTTTIRSILGFIRPTAGHAYVDGLESWEHSADIVKRIGYVPGEIAFPDSRTGIEFLRSQAEFLHLTDMSIADRLIERLQLDPRAGLKRMSKGMKQKTAIVAALMKDPEILILDEPTTGLDPLMRDSFMEIVKEEHRRGKTILMSSHMFEELEPLCDRVALISDGRIADTVRMDLIRKPSHREYKVEFRRMEDFGRFEGAGYEIVRRQPQYNQVTVRIGNEEINRLFRSLKEYDVKLVAEVKNNLERYFKNNLLKKESSNVQ